MSNLRGKRALVLGLGVHGGGLGVARWLVGQDAAVTVTDMASADALAVPIAALNAHAAAHGTSVRYVLGEHREADIRKADLLVANPAIRPDSPWLALAEAAGVAIESEMSLFFRACPGPILAVTGTKGKTTTATLLAAMLRERFPQTVLAGNLRVSALEALASIDAATPTVLELSSFQLEGLRRANCSPHYAAITNFSPDHLNYHGTMAAYAHAKQAIYAFHDRGGHLALPTELRTGPLAPPAEYPGHLVWVGTGGDLEWRAEHAYAGEERLFAAADLALPGSHNRANALLAAAVARQFGLDAAALRAAVGRVQAVEHRQELVATIDGVRYINDTTATNPAAAAVALQTIAGPIVLIAGGADKGLPLAPLAEAATSAKAVVLLAGSASAALESALRGAGQQAIAGPYASLEAGLAHATALAQRGDAVVLSPGCASFGMFRNEFHRGEEFRRLVQAIAEQRQHGEERR